MNNKIMKIVGIVIVNLITMIRLIGSFILPFIYYKYGASITSCFIIILFLTDYVDGFLARAWKVSTFWGCMMDAISDKVLNIIAFIILGLEHNIMFAPLIIEISILYTCYSTYRYGGNVKSTNIGKTKTFIVDIIVIVCFVLMALPTLKLNNIVINYLIKYTSQFIYVFGLAILVLVLIALFDYIKINKLARKNPKCMDIKYEKKNKKTFKTVMTQFFDTDYYLKHKDESIMKQLYFQ